MVDEGPLPPRLSQGRDRRVVLPSKWPLRAHDPCLLIPRLSVPSVREWHPVNQDSLDATWVSRTEGHTGLQGGPSSFLSPVCQGERVPGCSHVAVSSQTSSPDAHTPGPAGVWHRSNGVSSEVKTGSPPHRDINTSSRKTQDPIVLPIYDMPSSSVLRPHVVLTLSHRNSTVAVSTR